MKAHREALQILTLLILLDSFTHAWAYDIKPDIVGGLEQQSQPRSWQRKDCCYSSSPYEVTKKILLEQLAESEHFIRISDMINVVWEKHTHQR